MRSGGPVRSGGSARSGGAVRRGSAALARGARRGALASVRVAGRGSRATARQFRAFTSADGADVSGLARLAELHAVNVAADVALTVSLAGTVFALPTDEARGKVALFLVLTMAPFVLLAPLIGPLLDRFSHGRRWAIGTTLALRAFLSWVLVTAIVDDTAWLFPVALGALVASKTYAVTRAAAAPRLLPPSITLVKANSRLTLAGLIGMTVGGALAGGGVLEALVERHGHVDAERRRDPVAAEFERPGQHARDVRHDRVQAQRLVAHRVEVGQPGDDLRAGRITGCGRCRCRCVTSCGLLREPGCCRVSSPCSSPS